MLKNAYETGATEGLKKILEKEVSLPEVGNFCINNFEINKK